MINRAESKDRISAYPPLFFLKISCPVREEQMKEGQQKKIRV